MHRTDDVSVFGCHLEEGAVVEVDPWWVVRGDLWLETDLGQDADQLVDGLPSLGAAERAWALGQVTAPCAAGLGRGRLGVGQVAGDETGQDFSQQLVVALGVGVPRSLDRREGEAWAAGFVPLLDIAPHEALSHEAVEVEPDGVRVQTDRVGKFLHAEPVTGAAQRAEDAPAAGAHARGIPGRTVHGLAHARQCYRSARAQHPTSTGETHAEPGLSAWVRHGTVAYVSGWKGSGGAVVNHPVRLQLEEVVALASELVVAGQRTILGITGAPGAGKSLLAEAIVAELPNSTRVLGMDGFHFSQAELRRLQRADRKGAIDTFDADGYIALLRRLRTPDTTTVYAPRFDRSLEEPIGSAVPVPADVPLVVTEGNYLLVPDAPWNEVRELLDVCWYLEPGENVRTQRLIDRHRSFGRAPNEAYERAWGSDQRNAELVASTRGRADRILTITTTSITPATPAAPHRRR